MTVAELAAACRSLARVGPAWEWIARWVWVDNATRCTDWAEGTPDPWHS